MPCFQFCLSVKTSCKNELPSDEGFQPSHLRNSRQLFDSGSNGRRSNPAFVLQIATIDSFPVGSAVLYYAYVKGNDWELGELSSLEVPDEREQQVWRKKKAPMPFCPDFLFFYVWRLNSVSEASRLLQVHESGKV